MKSRALAFLVLASFLFSFPSRLEADKPVDPTFSGVLRLVPACADTPYALYDICRGIPTRVVVLDRMKGAKRFLDQRVLVQGTEFSATCGLPGVHARRITLDESPPQTCAGTPSAGVAGGR